MCLFDVDDVESGAVAITAVQIVEGGNLPPEGRSSVAAEDQHDGALSAMLGQADTGRSVVRLQVKVRCGVAVGKRAAARATP